MKINDIVKAYGTEFKVWFKSDAKIFAKPVIDPWIIIEKNLGYTIKEAGLDSKKVVEQIPVQVMLEFAKSINKLLGNVVNVNI